MINCNISINEFFPADILETIVSFAELKDLKEIAMTCSSWKKMGENAYWNKIFKMASNSDLTKQITVCNAISELAPLFTSKDLKDQLKLDGILNKCNLYGATAQIKFISYVYKLEIITSIFNHSLLSKVCKMKMIQCTPADMKLEVFKQLKWDEINASHGLKPTKYTPFKEAKIPHNYISKIHLNENNTFETDELVAVISDADLLFGRVKEKFKSLWRIHLERKDDNNWACIAIKHASEIGKFPTDCAFPDFCS